MKRKILMKTHQKKKNPKIKKILMLKKMKNQKNLKKIFQMSLNKNLLTKILLMK